MPYGNKLETFIIQNPEVRFSCLPEVDPKKGGLLSIHMVKLMAECCIRLTFILYLKNRANILLRSPPQQRKSPLEKVKQASAPFYYQYWLDRIKGFNLMDHGSPGPRIVKRFDIKVVFPCFAKA
jgi:hypothetical protein